MRRLGALAFALAMLTGCYSPASVRQAPVVYTGSSAKPARKVAECVRNRHLLARDLPLEVALDDRTGAARVTSVLRDTYAMNGGVWHWEMTITPSAGGSASVVRSNSSIWGPLVERDMLALIMECERT